MRSPVDVVVWFPRPRGRGPIEAFGTTGGCSGWSTGFPRPRGRGPIEAPQQPDERTLKALFPRPRGRGPIEAVRAMYIAFVSGGFPRPRGRGPIEARLAAACCPGTPR